MKLRIQQIKNHIEKDDYFVTIATILSLIAELSGNDMELLKQIDRANQKRIKTIKQLKDDLMYLQKHYIITKRKRCE